MKKYAVIHIKGDQFEDIYDTKEEAIKKAEYSWKLLTANEKKSCEFFAVMHGEVDEDECFDISTADIVRQYK